MRRLVKPAAAVPSSADDGRFDISSELEGFDMLATMLVTAAVFAYSMKGRRTGASRPRQAV